MRPMATDEPTKMYRVFSIVPRSGKKPLWLNIGTAYPHEKGDGFNILLQALPLQTGPGEVKLVARLYESKDDELDELSDSPASSSKKK